MSVNKPHPPRAPKAPKVPKTSSPTSTAKSGEKTSKTSLRNSKTGSTYSKQTTHKVNANKPAVSTTSGGKPGLKSGAAKLRPKSKQMLKARTRNSPRTKDTKNTRNIHSKKTLEYSDQTRPSFKAAKRPLQFKKPVNKVNKSSLVRKAKANKAPNSTDSAAARQQPPTTTSATQNQQKTNLEVNQQPKSPIQNQQKRKKPDLFAKFTANRGVEMLSSSTDPVIDFQERLREKRKARLAAIFYRVLSIVLVAGILASFVWVLWFSPIFALNSQRVTLIGELDDFDTSAIMETITEQQGTPLLRVDLNKIEQVAIADPNVESAKASLDWPNGVTLEITRRIPAFAILNDGTYEYVATDGVSVSTGNSTDGGLILLSVTDTQDQDQYADAISLASEVYGTFSEQLLEQIESMQVSARSATFTLTSGSQVIWGNADDAELKLQVLEILLSERCAATYDVSDPTRPATFD